ncbi:MAG: hypothetical protein IRZ31_07350 [Thermogemmatispora sp.]|uniref:hypothetical protein n=1 Tax=Thermogemmatispora TaxID=768669 RepID=UPI0011BF7AC2|nr:MULTISPECIES: hypothetical protein [Thermogemmatispora]MBX5456702.1 hypothetical protein [Thermogemmatispora sp.]
MTDQSTPQKILWIVEYTLGDSQYHHLEPIYASSRAEAEEQCRQLLTRFGQKVNLIDLRPYPHGFVVKHGRMPGNLTAGQEQETEEEPPHPPP